MTFGDRDFGLVVEEWWIDQLTALEECADEFPCGDSGRLGGVGTLHGEDGVPELEVAAGMGEKSVVADWPGGVVRGW